MCSKINEFERKKSEKIRRKNLALTTMKNFVSILKKNKNFIYIWPKRKAKEAILVLTTILSISLVFTYVLTISPTSIKGIFSQKWRKSHTAF